MSENTTPEPTPSDDIDMTPAQVLLRPTTTEREIWLELARSNKMTLSDCIRTAMAQAADQLPLYDQIKDRLKVAKQDRGRSMQAKRWGKKVEVAADLDAPLDGAEAELDEPLGGLDEPLGEDLDALLAE